ncbi:WXG100 family type VII secretion target [Sinomonas atrocyanea]|uniref:WXG100 family type VII secretion target n=1 Tax=Sinomonas atrocyanea TaxID=37927 RepID=UPI00285C566F|nr:WXG100 family type VII secretion target [Sinomonas atrocyanea]MDR6622864.1 uncharacterized protein YukE [Sinomonas atrocyanea]
MAITQGANPEQLRTLAQRFSRAGQQLAGIGNAVQGLSRTEAWKGSDADEFRTAWNRATRPQLTAVGQLLEETARTLRENAAAQESTSEAGTGSMHARGTGPGMPAGPGGPGGPGTGPGTGPDGRPWADGAIADAAAAQAWPPYGAVSTAVSGAGFAGDLLVSRMADAGLVTSKGGQLAEVGYIKGMQAVNGVRLAGQGASVLGIIGGGAQLYEGITDHNTYEAVDGGITAVLSTGALVGGPAAPAFAAAGLVWAGSGLLASYLGYSSTSAMFTDAGKAVYNAGKDAVEGVVDAGSQAVDAVADGAKKVWGWLGG